MPVQTTVQMRRDTAANWTSTNPTLASGEWGLETDTRLMKIGDGTTAWNSLAYQTKNLITEPMPLEPTGAYLTGSTFRTYGIVQNYLTSPDSAALDITGDIDIRVKVAMDDWTPSEQKAVVGKYGAAGTRAYLLTLNTDGKLQFFWHYDASNNLSSTSSVATGIADGATKWIRVTLDVDNGATQNETKFFTSDDGSSWTQLGTTITKAGITNIFNNSSALEIGSYNVGATGPASGVYYQVQILNGIAGTTAFDANFANVAADSFAFTESSTNAATVSLITTRYSFALPANQIFSTTSVGYGANSDFYHPFRVLQKSITIRHLAFEVTSATLNNGYIAIYAADSNFQPTGNALYASAAISISASAAVYRIRITPLTLNPGNYLVAVNVGQTTSFRQYTTSYSFIGATLGTAFKDAWRVSRTNAAFTNSPLQWNTFSTTTTGHRNPILMGWT